MTSAGNQIILDPRSRSWRRRLGALPWAVFEELAHQARPGEGDWIAPIGVRDLGTALGVTKDTAARALAALRSARLVSPVRAHTTDGRSRPGYQLHLPDGITIRSCTDNHDSNQHSDAACPDEEGTRCPEGDYASPSADRRSRPKRPSQRHSSNLRPVRTQGPVPPVQTSLFAFLPVAD